MFAEIIKSYQEESTDIVAEIYVYCADHFQGRHYTKHQEFIQNTPANIKSESLCKVLDGMIGDNKELKKVSDRMLDCFECMYAFVPDFYYICGLRDSAQISDIKDMETHIEKMLVMHRAKAYEECRDDTENYIKWVSCFERYKEKIGRELGEDARKVICDIETAEHEANETATIVDYIGGVFDAKLIMKFIGEHHMH